MVHILLATIVLIALFGRDKDRIITKIAFFLLFLFAALRYMYGNDYSNYLTRYNMIQNGWPNAFGQEILFAWINWLSPHFFVLIACTSLAYIWVMYRLITKNLPREHVWLGLLIFIISPYLFLVNLSAIRQCMAMLLFIVAVNFAYKRKIIPYIILVTVASLFHNSALVLLPMYFIITPKPVKTGKVLLILGGVLLAVSVVDVSAVSRLIAAWYGEGQYAAYASSDMQNSLRATLLSAVYFIFALMNLPRLEGKALVYGKLYMVGTMLGVLAFRLSALTRLQMYFDIFAVVAIPLILIEQRKDGKVRVDRNRPIGSVWDCVDRYALPVLVFLIFALRYYSFFTNPMWKSFATYRTIFEVL